MSQQPGDGSPACAHCGEPVASSGSNRRVRTDIEEGAVVYDWFCSDDCLENWSG